MVDCRPKLKHLQDHVQKDVKRMMSDQLHFRSPASAHQMKTSLHHRSNKPNFIVSSSVFGPKVTFHINAVNGRSSKTLLSFWSLMDSKNWPLTSLITCEMAFRSLALFFSWVGIVTVKILASTWIDNKSHCRIILTSQHLLSRFTAFTCWIWIGSNFEHVIINTF